LAASSCSAASGIPKKAGTPQKRIGVAKPQFVQEVIPMKSRPYQATNVKNVDIREIIRNREGLSCDVGLDTSKDYILVSVRWSNGSFERPWRVALFELSVLVSKLRELQQGRKMTIALEPTGTYCDPIRHALHNAQFEVYRVSPKASHDYAEIFDGVPSQHDGKDAACVAELSSMRKRTLWPWKLEANELRHEIEWMDAHQQAQTRWLGRIEGLLARYWPEASSILLISSGTLLNVLAHYGGPQNLAADPEASHRLRKWGGAKLKEKKIQRLLESAAKTAGVPQSPADVHQVQRYAEEALEARREIRHSKKRLKELIKDNDILQRMGKIVGLATAAVLWAYLGDPRKYHCANAYVKAMGLNLKIRSSGRWEGHLKITKRGHSRVRRWLYFAALRYCQDPWISPWYQKKKARGDGFAKRALVALMRKLGFALYYVGAHDREFDVQAMLPGAARYATKTKTNLNQKYANA
jgi:transposase